MSAEPKPKPYSLMPPHERMTPEEALEWAKRRGMRRVVILGEAHDGAEICVTADGTGDRPRPFRSDEMVYLLNTAILDVTGVFG